MGAVVLVLPLHRRDAHYLAVQTHISVALSGWKQINTPHHHQFSWPQNRPSESLLCTQGGRGTEQRLRFKSWPCLSRELLPP